MHGSLHDRLTHARRKLSKRATTYEQLKQEYAKAHTRESSVDGCTRIARYALDVNHRFSDPASKLDMANSKRDRLEQLKGGMYAQL
jgi:hypothetical protein